MVSYKCEIEFLPKGDGSLTSVTLPTGNNISKFNGGNVSGSSIESPNVGAKPFIIGVSKIGDGSQLLSGYNGYISKTLSNADGTCDFTMTINGENIDNFTIHFDKVVNEYATEIYIDDVKYVNDDTHFFMNVINQNSHTVRFTKWSKGNSNIRFTAITIGLTLTFDKFNGLLSFVRGSQSMQDNTLPTYGAISQYGSVRLADYTGEINDIEQLNMLTSGIKVKLYLDDELVGDYLFESFDKENETIYNIQLNDEIIKWNDIIVDSIKLQENKTAKDLYDFLVSQYEANYESLSDYIENYLSYIKIKYYYLESGSLFSQWNKFCDLTQMLVFKKPNGKIALRRLQ